MITRLLILILIVNLWVISLRVVAQKILSPDSAPISGQIQSNTLYLKLKPQYAAAANRSRQGSQVADPLQLVLTQLKARSFQPKFPKAATFPRLKPGQVDLTLWYEIQHQRPDLSFTQLRQMLLATGFVDFVEPVYQPQLLYQPTDPLADSVTGKQFYLKQVQAYRAWDIEKGDSSVVIGILDTGTRLDHEDLKNTIKHNYADPVDGRDNDQDGFTDNFSGWDLADNDNDPSGPNSHGTFVTGMTAGDPDNNKGIAGIGFNCRYLPVKVFSSQVNGNFKGYEGIVYAADRGCQVINLSWGGDNPYSQYEQDVINYAAINKNVVVVAAAGNTPKETSFYPASYENVLAVSAVNKNDVKDPSQTFNYQIDLTAPGIEVTTTSNNGTNTYAAVGGSSFASPVVAGAAGLLRHHFPDYTARQIAERLRVTADNNYGAGNNLNFLEKLGYGRVNAYRALAASAPKSVRNTHNIVDYQRAFASRTMSVSGTFQNILAPTEDLFVTLSSPSPYVSIIRSTFAAGSMATLASKTNLELPFQVLIRPDIPFNQPVVFRYGFSDGVYTDYQYFTLTLNPNYITLTVNDLDATVTSNGNFGFNDLDTGNGEGVKFKNFGPLLSEGGLMIGTSPEKVADNLRNEALKSDDDFQVVAGIQFVKEGKRADEEATGVFQDKSSAAGMVGVKVKQRAFAWQDAPDNQYVILEYQITNTTQDSLTNLHAGLFADWDIANYTNNTAAWDSVTRTGYTYQPNLPNVYAGVSLLTPQAVTTYAINNPAQDAQALNLRDGFTDAEKFTALRNTDRLYQNSGNLGSDVAQVVGAALNKLAPGESTTLAFAVLGAESLPNLKQQAQAALSKYQQIKTGNVVVLQTDSVCIGATATIRPSGGQRFRFYADLEKTNLLGTGAAFTTPPITTAARYYISNVDSLYESALTPVTIVPANTPVNFTFTPDPVPASAKGQVQFTDASRQAKEWHWDFGNGTQSREQNPTVQYTQPGDYSVTLRVTNQYGCVDSLTKIIKIKYVDYIQPWQASDFKIYPIPTPQTLTIAVSEGINATQGLTVTLTDALGRRVYEKVSYQTGLNLYDLTSLASGIYYLRVSGQNGMVTRRIELIK
ncbi:S8 family serine peptidase [Adhaeribacter pallidiroseus]|uniref:Extracellular subtilisin-like protease n=1 Tax=Adhaeribacter pallidiroseus TaxID=2072847 RepID=A0A369QB05_9BACT|nr:S8 family serine peptidase [Adhaeribacter pallidiroseus]RDC61884.1 Extracellular subtilisin-like protease [Adhaeribacter pallidiroseus]